MITATGFDIKRFPDIVAELETALKTELGADIDLSSDSLLGILNSIYAAGLTDQWSLAQEVYSAFNIATAEGKQLDDLVALVGISRLAASPTNGNIEFTGTPSATISAGVELSDVNGNAYQSSEDVLLTLLAATHADIGVAVVQNSTLYSITVDSTTYTHTSAPSATEASILNGLLTSIGTPSTFTAALNTAGDRIVITTATALSELVITFSSNLTSDSVTSLGAVAATTEGAIQTLANTLTEITVPVANLTAVNNPVALVTGREQETDEELRLRQASSTQIAGTATVPAIEATLRQLQGVLQAVVIENRGTTTDSSGRPAKSYECVVDGGTNEDIAQSIWDTKPAGVETYGSITEIVVDSQGSNQAIRFSRPEAQYIWVDVDYTLYDEESFPTGGEDAIKQAIADYGNTLLLGNDVIPKRFYGTTYANVSGIEDLTITMASSGTDPNTSPSPGAFLEDAIDITGSQVANFDVTRITVTAV